MSGQPAFVTTREITRQECPWLKDDIAAGVEVKKYRGFTYGCIGPRGVAVCFDADGPFFELPRLALSAALGDQP